MQGVVKPRIVVVMAPKGGVGKTVCTMALLVSARLAGLRVMGIGTDPQGSLEAWGEARARRRQAEDGNRFVDVPVRTLRLGEYRRLKSIGDADVLVVDTPPGHQSDATDMEALAALADLVLIPTGQTGQDLLHTIAFNRGLAARRSFFVLNRVKRRTKSFEAAKGRLLRAGRLCAADIPDREAVHLAYSRGLVVADIGGPGADDFDGLWSFVASELDLPRNDDASVEGNHAA